MRTLVLLALLSIALSLWSPPDYSQCSSSWGSEKLGGGPYTICQAGCLMSSMASAIAGLSIQVDGQTSNPGTFNTWLDQNGGYTDGDLYVWGAADKLGLSFVGFDHSGAQAAESFQEGKIVILNVRDGKHWVLATGLGNNEFEVMDPYFNTPTYSFASVVEAGVYSKPSKSTKEIESDEALPSGTVRSSSANPSNAMSGVDISMYSGAVSQSTMQCLANQGKKFIIIEGWNGGHQINSDLANNVKNAWAAGFKAVDIYAFFCDNCGGNSPPAAAISKLSNYLKQNNVKYGTLWLDVEPSSGAWGSSSSNLNYIVQLAQAAQKAGINVGVYTSIGSWGDVVGSDSSGYLAGLPLWYAHYNQNPQMTDTSDYEFGGWKKAIMKQYTADANLCGLDTDLDYAPNGLNSTNITKSEEESAPEEEAEQNPEEEEESTPEEEEYTPEEEEEEFTPEEEEQTPEDEEESTPEEEFSEDEEESGGDEEESGGDEEESGGDEEESGGDEEESGGDEEESGGDEEESSGDEEESGADEEESGADEEGSGDDEEGSGDDEEESSANDEESGESGADDEESGADEEESGADEEESLEESITGNSDDLDYVQVLEKIWLARRHMIN